MEALRPLEGKRRRTGTLAALLIVLVHAGSFTSLLGSILYALSPVRAKREAGSTGCLVCEDAWLTYVMTLGVIVLEIGLTLPRELRSSRFAGLRARTFTMTATWRTRRLCVSAALRLGTAFTTLLALSLLNPEVAGILRATLQLLLVNIARRAIYGKKQTLAQWLCMSAAAFGTVLMIVDDLVYHPDAGPLGTMVVALSAAFAAGRVMLQRAMLQRSTLCATCLSKGCSTIIWR